MTACHKNAMPSPQHRALGQRLVALTLLTPRFAAAAEGGIDAATEGGIDAAAVEGGLKAFLLPTQDSSETTRAAHVLVVSAVLLPTILLSRRTLRVVLPATALLVIAIVFQVRELDVDTAYWGHCLISACMLRASNYVINGDGGALITKARHGVLGFAMSLALLLFVVLRLPLSTFYNQVHATIWALAALYFISLASHGIVEARWPAALPRLAAARALHDPAVLGALGVLLYTHLHDMSGIGMYFHQAWGVMLLGVAATGVCSAAAHAAAPRATASAAFARAVHAFAWVLTGVWGVHMAAFLYIFNGKRGIHQLLYGDLFGHHHATEVGGFYLAIDIWVSAAALGAMLPPPKAKVAAKLLPPDEEEGLLVK